MPDLISPDAGHDRRDTIAESYWLDDRDVRRQLDRLARLAARLCDAPLALVSLVLEDRQVFLGRSGLDADGTPREQSFCAHAMLHEGCMIVPDARLDPRFSTNPLVTGAPHIRFYAGQPLVSRDGARLGSFCVIDDAPRAGLSPDQLEMLETLAEAAMALLERWRQDGEHRRHSIATRVQLAHLEQRFDVLVDTLPQLVWSTLPDGMSDYFSAQWCKFTGQPAAASFGSGWLDFLHPEDVETALAAWTTAVATGESYAVNFRVRRHDDEYVWMLVRGLPIRDEHGAVIRWIGTCTDIQGQVHSSELLEMMSQELSHRIKNLFAVTQGLITMTLRNHPELKPLAGEMQSRLLALGRAHDLVRPQLLGTGIGQPDTSLHVLLDRLLQPYAAGEHKPWRIVGSDLMVGEQAATPIALFIHEIGTNSVKYGALSAADGFVAIAVTIAAPGLLTIRWHEQGGPPVVEPGQRGFGYRLAELSIVRQLRGQLEFEWQATGLVVTASIPVAQISARGTSRAATSAEPGGCQSGMMQRRAT